MQSVDSGGARLDLSRIWVSENGTHHILNGRALYERRFRSVLKFRPPGLAAADDQSGAFHINLDGEPAYSGRFQRTFGFYEDRAAIQSDKGWSHVDLSGSFVYQPTLAWVGNFREGRCPVRRQDGNYYHIQPEGSPAYKERWRYAGDYRDGIACVQHDDGLYTHIDRDGKLRHGRTFHDLDVFHKGYARARDARGWHHIDISGRPAYRRRFASVEPFYNGQARAQGHDGRIEVIDESGETLVEVREARTTTS